MNPQVQAAQAPLRALYARDPASAQVTDHALTRGIDPADPFHSIVETPEGAGARIPVGVHRGVGGPYDAPCPGDLLCAALAACQDSSVRMVANLLGVELVALTVDVRASVDLRGAMGLDPDVPVGFQSITCEIDLRAKEGTSPAMLERLRVAAERCCVVQQTLRNPPTVLTTFRA